jgi:hypothetical protein
MPRRVAKAIRVSVNKKIIDTFLALGAKKDDDDYYKVNTQVGELRFTIHDDSIYAGIYARFDDVAAAKTKVYYGPSSRLNPYSGKWNWHFDWDQAEMVLQQFEREVRDLL